MPNLVNSLLSFPIPKGMPPLSATRPHLVLKPFQIHNESFLSELADRELNYLSFPILPHHEPSYRQLYCAAADHEAPSETPHSSPPPSTTSSLASVRILQGRACPDPCWHSLLFGYRQDGTDFGHIILTILPRSRFSGRYRCYPGFYQLVGTVSPGTPPLSRYRSSHILEQTRAARLRSKTPTEVKATRTNASRARRFWWCHRLAARQAAAQALWGNRWNEGDRAGSGGVMCPSSS